MLRRYKKFVWSVLSLLLVAWALQNAMPIITVSLTHHSETAMHCDLESGCSSCQLEGKTVCTCKHDDTGEMRTSSLTLCGCSQHDAAATGFISISPLKAIFYGAPAFFQGSPNTLFMPTSEFAYPLLANDIFHPPRPIA